MRTARDRCASTNTGTRPANVGSLHSAPPPPTHAQPRTRTLAKFVSLRPLMHVISAPLFPSTNVRPPPTSPKQRVMQMRSLEARAVGSRGEPRASACACPPILPLLLLVLQQQQQQHFQQLAGNLIWTQKKAVGAC